MHLVSRNVQCVAWMLAVNSFEPDCCSGANQQEDAAALSPAQHTGENAAAEAVTAVAIAAHMAQGGAIALCKSLTCKFSILFFLFGILAGLPLPSALGDAANVVAADVDGAATNAAGPFLGREDGRMPIGPDHIQNVMEAVRLQFTQGIVARTVRVGVRVRVLYVLWSLQRRPWVLARPARGASK